MPRKNAGEAEPRSTYAEWLGWLGDRARGKHDDLVVRHAAAVRGVEQLADPHRGNRAAEQIALRLGYRAVGADQFELFIGLDAFDNDLHAEVGRQPRHPTQQRQRTIGVNAFQEGTVDLHLLQWEVVQITQAGIAGAEIIQRDAYADGAQLREHVMGQLRVAQQRG